jgi:hypothetical protein
MMVRVRPAASPNLTPPTYRLLNCGDVDGDGILDLPRVASRQRDHGPPESGLYVQKEMLQPRGPSSPWASPSQSLDER